MLKTLYLILVYRIEQICTCLYTYTVFVYIIVIYGHCAVFVYITLSLYTFYLFVYINGVCMRLLSVYIFVICIQLLCLYTSTLFVYFTCVRYFSMCFFLCESQWIHDNTGVYTAACVCTWISVNEHLFIKKYEIKLWSWTIVRVILFHCLYVCVISLVRELNMVTGCLDTWQ